MAVPAAMIVNGYRLPAIGYRPGRELTFRLILSWKLEAGSRKPVAFF
jgi:hypothetical protein